MRRDVPWQCPPRNRQIPSMIKTSQVRNHRGQSDDFRYMTSVLPLSPTVCLSFHLALCARTGHSRYETVLIEKHARGQGERAGHQQRVSLWVLREAERRRRRIHLLTGRPNENRFALSPTVISYVHQTGGNNR